MQDSFCNLCVPRRWLLWRLNGIATSVSCRCRGGCFLYVWEREQVTGVSSPGSSTEFFVCVCSGSMTLSIPPLSASSKEREGVYGGKVKWLFSMHILTYPLLWNHLILGKTDTILTTTVKSFEKLNAPWELILHHLISTSAPGEYCMSIVKIIVGIFLYTCMPVVKSKVYTFTFYEHENEVYNYWSILI